MNSISLFALANLSLFDYFELLRHLSRCECVCVCECVGQASNLIIVTNDRDRDRGRGHDHLSPYDAHYEVAIVNLLFSAARERLLIQLANYCANKFQIACGNNNSSSTAAALRQTWPTTKCSLHELGSMLPPLK